MIQIMVGVINIGLGPGRTSTGPGDLTRLGAAYWLGAVVKLHCFPRGRKKSIRLTSLMLKWEELLSRKLEMSQSLHDDLPPRLAGAKRKAKQTKLPIVLWFREHLAAFACFGHNQADWLLRNPEDPLYESLLDWCSFHCSNNSQIHCLSRCNVIILHPPNITHACDGSSVSPSNHSTNVFCFDP